MHPSKTCTPGVSLVWWPMHLLGSGHSTFQNIGTIFMIPNHDTYASGILCIVLINFLTEISLTTLVEYVSFKGFKKEIEYLLIAQRSETTFL